MANLIDQEPTPELRVLTSFVMLIHLPPHRTVEGFDQAPHPATIAALPDQLRRSLTCDMPDTWPCITTPSSRPTHRLLRQYFPKGTSPRHHSPDDLVAVARQPNGRPRKTLNSMTPAEALNDILNQPSNTPVLRQVCLAGTLFSRGRRRGRASGGLVDASGIHQLTEAFISHAQARLTQLGVV